MIDRLCRLLQDEKLRYLVVGGWNTAFGCALYAALYALLATRVHYLALAVASHLLSVLNAWLCYRNFVFKSKGEPLAEYLRFNLSMLAVLLFQVGTLWVLVHFMGLHPVASQIAILVMTVILSYAIHSHFSFQKNRTGN
jgi:putative flippase GtrA